ncbi:MAG: helix-turn-helix transcriptional regulator [Chloroflexi bacterium]|nr:helix-turn-helix transcriptional regulator [Chloroflexota bacterium]
MIRLQDWIDEFQGDPDYEFDKLAVEVGEQIFARMEELGMTQADLARQMGVSRARISQILRGNDNLTLKSIVGVAIGLESRVDVQLKPVRSIGRLSRRDCRPVIRMGAHMVGEDPPASVLAAAA